MLQRSPLILGALVSVALGAFATPAPAQSPTGTVTFDPALFRPLRWRNIGPTRAGRSVAAAGSASRPLEYYAGFAGGGLWKTTDGGTTWAPMTDGWIRSSSVGAVAVSESDPDVVYIGMGEVQIQRNSLQGDGVYGSRDGGRSWTYLGLDDSQVIARVRVHPEDPDIVYAAAFGHPWGPSGERGVYRSLDGGRSWERILYRDDRTGAVDLVIHPADPATLFAALWEARVGAGGRTDSGGPGSGLFRSTDGGDTWVELTRRPGMPEGTIGKIGVTVSAADRNRVYALVEAEDGGVFRSDDAGETWTLLNNDGGLRQRPPYFNRIQADPNDADVVYVLNLQLFRSADGGRTYETVRTPHVDHHDLWIAPGDSRRMLDSNDGGPTVSVNGGESWTAQAIPTAQFFNLATTRDVPYQVCGPQQDESAVCVPSTQSRWRSSSPYVGSDGLDGPWYAPGGGEFGMVAPHPEDPDLFFATGPNVITRYHRRSGLVQARDIQVRPPSSSGSARERFTSIAPIVFSRRDPDILYAGSQHVWRLHLSSLVWERISTDLTQGAGSILSIAPSYVGDSTIWVGTNDGLVQVTRNGGASWQDVTPGGLPPGARVSSIEASPHGAGVAYVAANRYEMDDRAPYLFRTRDYGSTWTPMVEGIPPGEFVLAVREDPERPGLLFAGTDHGVRVSFDAGDVWEPLSLNLPDVSVPDLVVEGADLVIATQGRSFWVLGGITPLRELGAEVTAAPLHVFQPSQVVRRIAPAVIDYMLDRPASAVTIQILDSAGVVVRSFESGRGQSRGQGRNTGGGAVASGDVGLNRFTWDLRYEPATVFPGMILWVGTPAGPIAAPGRYQVRVRANGVTRARSFEIVRDPLAQGVTDADLQAQFSLALAARDAITDANQGVILIRDLAAQIEDRITTAGEGPVSSNGMDLLQSLRAVEGQLYQVRLRSQLDAIQYPIMLNNRLANLKLSIETGDGRPTPQHYEAYEQLSGDLTAQLQQLDALIESELDGFNRLLATQGLAAVEVRR